jgi:hypothetical protein
MSSVVQETEALGNTGAKTFQTRLEFSQQYSAGELEEMGSRELLDGYADELS